MRLARPTPPFNDATFPAPVVHLQELRPVVTLTRGYIEPGNLPAIGAAPGGASLISMGGEWRRGGKPSYAQVLLLAARPRSHRKPKPRVLLPAAAASTPREEADRKGSEVIKVKQKVLWRHRILGQRHPPPHGKARCLVLLRAAQGPRQKT